MKQKYRLILYFILNSFSISNLNAQLIRGGSEGEIYINSDWYYDGYYSHYGLFYSNNNGQDIEVMYEYTSPLQTNSPLGLILDDADSGVLYNTPVYSSDFMISTDHGHSWEILNIIPAHGEMTSGSVPGELYYYGFSSGGYLQKSTNYGQSFDTINSGVLYAFRVGASPGVLFGRTSQQNYLTYISYDGGYSFTDSIVLDTSITGGYLKDIYRGTNPGEVYLVSFWEPDNYKIFFSSDNGHSWQYRFRTIEVGDWSFMFTPGKESGSFYIGRMTLDQLEQHSILYIDYSSDTAKTFTTYFHDLTPDVGIHQNDDFSDSVKIFCYPNPSSGLLHISILEGYNFTEQSLLLRIYNSHGLKMDELIIHPDNGEVRINTASLPAGLYYAYLMTSDQKIYVNKFIVSKH